MSIYWAEQFYQEESERLRVCLDCGDDLRPSEHGRCDVCTSLDAIDAAQEEEQWKMDQIRLEETE